MLKTLAALASGGSAPAESPKPVQFPVYLVPSPLPFRRRRRSSGTSTPPTSSRRESSASTSSALSAASSASTALTIPEPDDRPPSPPLRDRTQLFRCSTCHSDLCFTTAIISKGFHGRHGRAYLLSSLSTPHLALAPPESRGLSTGTHIVRDMSCTLCGAVIGWKYVGASSERQRYKVGRYILEREKVVRVNVWDGGAGRDGEEEGYESEGEREIGELMESPDVDLDDEEQWEAMFRGAPAEDEL